MSNPIITLLTDFGTKDHYAASLKGVILGINPRVSLVDITHQVSPQDVTEGAFLLGSAFSFFPRGTIHVAVVDPGVGGPRKPILVVTSNHYFIGPDNGIFTFVLQREKAKKVLALSNSKYFLSRVSKTFHGRDIFAPVAAYLSLGIKPEAFGNRLSSWEKLNPKKPVQKGSELQGEVLHIDRFGNLITNIDEQLLFDFAEGRGFSTRIGKRTIRGLKRGYWEGERGQPIALIGSSGFLEVSMREGSAQRRLKVEKGETIVVHRNVPQKPWPSGRGKEH